MVWMMASLGSLHSTLLMKPLNHITKGGLMVSINILPSYNQNMLEQKRNHYFFPRLFCAPILMFIQKWQFLSVVFRVEWNAIMMRLNFFHYILHNCSIYRSNGFIKRIKPTNVIQSIDRRIQHCTIFPIFNFEKRTHIDGRKSERMRIGRNCKSRGIHDDILIFCIKNMNMQPTDFFLLLALSIEKGEGNSTHRILCKLVEKNCTLQMNARWERKRLRLSYLLSLCGSL